MYTTNSETTPYEYLLLAIDSYKDSENQGLPTNWEQVIDNSDFMISEDNHNGYFGAVYINHIRKEIVITHRGTEGISDMVTDGYLAYGVIPPQFMDDDIGVVDATTLAQKVINYRNLNYSDYTLSSTGHSLGGYLAKMLGTIINDLNVIAFDAPGIQKTLDNNNLVFLPSISVTEYLAAPNQINTCAGHNSLFSLNRLYPKYTPHITEDNYGLAHFSKGFTLQQHSKIGFLDCFNPTTGQPYVYSQPDSWPTDGKAWFESYTLNPHYWDEYFDYKGFTKAERLEEIEKLGGLPSVISQGVAIYSDNSNNEIFGTTLYQDTIISAGGTDKVYIYGGNVDVQGNNIDDKYVISVLDSNGYTIQDPSGVDKYIFKSATIGQEVIEDADMSGSLYVIDTSRRQTIPLTGTARYVTTNTGEVIDGRWTLDNTSGAWFMLERVITVDGVSTPDALSGGDLRISLGGNANSSILVKSFDFDTPNLEQIGIAIPEVTNELNLSNIPIDIYKNILELNENTFVLLGKDTTDSSLGYFSVFNKDTNSVVTSHRFASSDYQTKGYEVVKLNNDDFMLLWTEMNSSLYLRTRYQTFNSLGETVTDVKSLQEDVYVGNGVETTYSSYLLSTPTSPENKIIDLGDNFLVYGTKAYQTPTSRIYTKIGQVFSKTGQQKASFEITDDTNKLDTSNRSTAILRAVPFKDTNRFSIVLYSDYNTDTSKDIYSFVCDYDTGIIGTETLVTITSNKAKRDSSNSRFYLPMTKTFSLDNGQIIVIWQGVDGGVFARNIDSDNNLAGLERPAVDKAVIPGYTGTPYLRDIQQLDSGDIAVLFRNSMNYYVNTIDGATGEYNQGIFTRAAISTSTEIDYPTITPLNGENFLILNEKSSTNERLIRVCKVSNSLPLETLSFGISEVQSYLIKALENSDSFMYIRGMAVGKFELDYGLYNYITAEYELPSNQVDTYEDDQLIEAQIDSENPSKTVTVSGDGHSNIISASNVLKTRLFGGWGNDTLISSSAEGSVTEMNGVSGSNVFKITPAVNSAVKIIDANIQRTSSEDGLSSVISSIADIIDLSAFSSRGIHLARDLEQAIKDIDTGVSISSEINAITTQSDSENKGIEVLLPDNQTLVINGISKEEFLSLDNSLFQDMFVMSMDSQLKVNGIDASDVANGLISDETIVSTLTRQIESSTDKTDGVRLFSDNLTIESYRPTITAKLPVLDSATRGLLDIRERSLVDGSIIATDKLEDIKDTCFINGAYTGVCIEEIEDINSINPNSPEYSISGSLEQIQALLRETYYTPAGYELLTYELFSSTYSLTDGVESLGGELEFDIERIVPTLPDQNPSLDNNNTLEKVGVIGAIAIGVGALAYSGYKLCKSFFGKKDSRQEDNVMVDTYDTSSRDSSDTEEVQVTLESPSDRLDIAQERVQQDSVEFNSISHVEHVIHSESQTQSETEIIVDEDVTSSSELHTSSSDSLHLPNSSRSGSEDKDDSVGLGV